MRILIITWDYPDEKRSVFPFVKNLVEEWARQGHHCTVISPYSITNNKRLHKLYSEEEYGGGHVIVLRPNYISLSNLKVKGVSLTSYLHKKAVNRALNLIKNRPDVVYCHFWNSAFEVFEYANMKNLPLFVATGESTFEGLESNVTECLNSCLSGVIAVSSKNRDESIKLGLGDVNMYRVMPNAVNASVFKKRDKEECRKKLQFPLDAFIIVYVGWFNERKGSKRVEAALKQIKGEQVYSIFIGSGDEEPIADGILFKGSLKHSEIPEYLNAADVFVLPTLNEGCCNAVVEAMACGLPIISSDLPFNKDVCDESNSILVDPLDISAIKNAIVLLRDDREFREQLSKGASKKAELLTIDKRASSIIDFIQEKINKKI